MSQEFVFNIENAVRRTLEDAIATAIDDQVKQAQVKVAEEIRSQAAAISTRVLSFFEMHMQANRLIISIDLGKNGGN